MCAISLCLQNKWNFITLALGLGNPRLRQESSPLRSREFAHGTLNTSTYRLVSRVPKEGVISNPTLPHQLWLF